MSGEEEIDEATARKKRLRAAHRGSATRLLSQVDTAIASPDLPRLRQLQRSLISKQDVLSKLDDEMIELVREDELDQEVENADVIQEKISLAVINIDKALDAIMNPPDTHDHRSQEGERHSPSPESVNSEEHLPSRPSSATLTAEETDTAALHIPPATDPASTPPARSPHVAAPEAHHPLIPRTSIPSVPSLAITTTSLGPPTTTVVHGTSTLVTSATHGVVPSSTLPTTATLHDVTSLTPSIPPIPSSRVIGSQVKLPKLSIRRFNGDLTKWVTFWDSFNSSIHTNPTLSSVDKFNYLTSLLEFAAAKAIAGLTLTAANYDEAIATLKKRFGNPQLIINRHMEALLNVSAVSSHHDVKCLRRLHDSVEAHVRGLRALGVPSDSYGGLLTSVLVNKLPPELRLIVSRAVTGEHWDLDMVMKVFEQEVDARECACLPSATSNQRGTQSRIPTAATLVASDPPSNAIVTCVFCDRKHQSVSCTQVIDISARKEILRRAGRCYICLKKHHLSRDCRSNMRCGDCRGRHHITICHRRTTSHTDASTPSRSTTNESSSEPGGTAPVTTSAFCSNTRASVLLQTAQLHLFNPHSTQHNTVARAIMDSGSQRTYITRRLRDELNLPAVASESLRIKTFGNATDYESSCDTVQLSLKTKDYGTLNIAALVVPTICHPLTSQPINYSQDHYTHLKGLKLADTAGASDKLEVDILIGSDAYWSLVTGKIIRGRNGPIAIQTKVGWVLSGPTKPQETAVNLTLTPTHVLKIDACALEPSLDDRLKQFWDLESLGISKDETSVYDKFVQQIRFDGQRYEVSLPWKEHHPPLPDHLDLCHKRLTGLIKRLKQNPQLLEEYNAIIQDQLNQGMVEVLTQPEREVSHQVHYLPHHGVIRQDKTTSKLRIVYDASARSTGPSLNECLYTGPRFGQSIFDILLRFQLQHVALIGDIEKAFLMVSVRERDRDSLRFLWVPNPDDENPGIATFRFSRVVFGVSSSPFLLNATINHHMETYRDSDPVFVDKFLSSIYVDDLVTGSVDVDSTYELYTKSRIRLAKAGFKLRKFVTNSEELHQLIQERESSLDRRETGEKTHVEEDQSYAKSSLGVKTEERPGTSKVLGILWDVAKDELRLDVGDVMAYATGESEPTKRSVASLSARFFDPLGVVAPVTVLFKIFARHSAKQGLSGTSPCLDLTWKLGPNF